VAALGRLRKYLFFFHIIMNRPTKESAIRFACKWTRLYSEIFYSLCQDGGRVQINSRYALIRQNLGSYVQMYDDEKKLGVALMLWLLGDDGFKEFNDEAASWSEQEQADFLAYACGGEGEKDIEESLNLPQTDTEWAEQEKFFQSLPDDEKTEATKRGAYFFKSFFAQFFNTLALMTHGAKLTTLVPLALQGDPDAFLKAVQVDRLLLTHHPYFIKRKQEAQDKGEDDFLKALAYRESNPNLKGKIRYPGLFMLFGILESIRWLDDLKHEEILDLCDEIGLDRFQNRIEDVNYLTKRLIDYRRFQKSGGVSMH
jgi:hypothetical protein